MVGGMAVNRNHQGHEGSHKEDQNLKHRFRLLAQLDGRGVADFLDGRSDNRGGVFGVVKFQVHAASDVLEFQHGASPCGAGDGDVNGVRTKFGMAGDESFAASEEDGGVAMMQGLDVKDRGGREFVEKDSAFDFGLDDGVVDGIGEIRMRAEHGATLLG